jgi:hypothetical protein
MVRSPGFFWPVTGVTMPLQINLALYSSCNPPSVRHGCVPQARALRFGHLLEVARCGFCV